MGRRVLLLGFLSLVVTTGCVRQTMRDYHADIERLAQDSPSKNGNADVAGTETPAPNVREIVVANETPAEESPQSGPGSRGAPAGHPLRPEPTLFRLGAGYGALGLVDLASCRNQGLPPGYLRMRVTFQQNGRVAHAAVETAVAPPSEALTCIGERLEAAMVPVFDGGDVTLSKSFFVN